MKLTRKAIHTPELQARQRTQGNEQNSTARRQLSSSWNADVFVSAPPVKAMDPVVHGSDKQQKAVLSAWRELDRRLPQLEALLTGWLDPVSPDPQTQAMRDAVSLIRTHLSMFPMDVIVEDLEAGVGGWAGESLDDNRIHVDAGIVDRHPGDTELQKLLFHELIHEIMDIVHTDPNEDANEEMFGGLTSLYENRTN